MGISITYIDTSYIMGLAEDDKEIINIFYGLKNPSFSIRVPQIVMGEAIAVISTKSNAYNLQQRLATHMTEYIPPNAIKPFKFEMLDIVYNLKKKDNRLDPTDALITAQALEDKNSKFLFTHDNTILKSSGIRELEEELRNGGTRNTRLKIKEAYRR